MRRRGFFGALAGLAASAAGLIALRPAPACAHANIISVWPVPEVGKRFVRRDMCKDCRTILPCRHLAFGTRPTALGAGPEYSGVWCYDCDAYLGRSCVGMSPISQILRDAPPFRMPAIDKRFGIT